MAALALAVHFVCVSLALGLPFLVWVDDCCRLKKRREAVDAHEDDAAASTLRSADRACGETLVHALLWLAATALTGLLVGWLFWEPALAGALRRVGSRLHFAVIEYCFSLLLVAVCCGWLLKRPAASRVGRFWRVLLQVAAWTNLVYHFPAFFTVVGELHSGERATEILTSAEFRQRTFRMRTVWVWTHMFAAGVLISVLYVQTLAQIRLGFWNSRRAGHLLVGALIAIWLSGWGLQMHQPRRDLLHLYSATHLPFTVGWMACAIGTSMGFLGVIAGVRARVWLAGTWALLGLTFWAMARLTLGE